MQGLNSGLTFDENRVYRNVLKRIAKNSRSTKPMEVKCQEIWCAPTAREIQESNTNDQKHQRDLN